MAKRLHVGNLGYTVSSEELQELFEQFGPVRSVQVLTDPDSGRGRGFGYVEMINDADAEKAIETLDGNDNLGRRLNVTDARPRNPGNPGGQGGR